jgi:hypothetical protein
VKLLTNFYQLGAMQYYIESDIGYCAPIDYAIFHTNNTNIMRLRTCLLLIHALLPIVVSSAFAQDDREELDKIKLESCNKPQCISDLISKRLIQNEKVLRDAGRKLQKMMLGQEFDNAQYETEKAQLITSELKRQINELSSKSVEIWKNTV